ncbi:hypothetical protein PPERSA_02485 [Pseudocohnilembus persalinus]|uniref:Uncharacterized protein n=1 Tax=Pseudocohnilembus persalinus TaxID=266149 RepID=A0A0V0QAV5_PSEPJ|nr:hypothetical protein PPERSA_02485 [Pseudocohnilembus persalinus]|eukprot:KRW99373.1 hypothetical protein PPERSA_02485 [Pseudocohnilembus persalinus]
MSQYQGINEKYKLIESMTKLIEKASARFLCEIMHNNKQVQELFCEYTGILSVSGKITLNGLPDCFYKIQKFLPQIFEIIEKNDQYMEEDINIPLAWYIDSNFKPGDAIQEKIITPLDKQPNESYVNRGFELVQNFPDPLQNLIGVYINNSFKVDRDFDIKKYRQALNSSFIVNQNFTVDNSLEFNASEKNYQDQRVFYPQNTGQNQVQSTRNSYNYNSANSYKQHLIKQLNIMFFAKYLNFNNQIIFFVFSSQLENKKVNLSLKIHDNQIYAYAQNGKPSNEIINQGSKIYTPRVSNKSQIVPNLQDKKYSVQYNNNNQNPLTQSLKYDKNQIKFPQNIKNNSQRTEKQIQDSSQQQSYRQVGINNNKNLPNKKSNQAYNQHQNNTYRHNLFQNQEQKINQTFQKSFSPTQKIQNDINKFKALKNHQTNNSQQQNQLSNQNKNKYKKNQNVHINLQNDNHKQFNKSQQPQLYPQTAKNQRANINDANQDQRYGSTDQKYFNETHINNNDQTNKNQTKSHINNDKNQHKFNFHQKDSFFNQHKQNYQAGENVKTTYY